MTIDQGFMNELIKEADNEFAGTVDDEKKFRDSAYIDTGSYALNALLSGSIYGGVPDDKVVGWAGEEAVGKTYFNLAVLKHFLDNNEGAMVCVFESEHAINRKILKSRGIDPSRVAMLPVQTIEEFRTQAVRMLDKYCAQPEKKRPPVMFALDSLGNLSSLKEVADITSGTDKRDMTKQQLIRGAFRVLTLKMGKADVGFMVTNHVYKKTGVAFGDPTEMSGGGGLKYAASIIVYLSKAQYKEGTDLKGAVITCKLNKGRETKEKLKVKVLLHHEHGLDRYYGLLDIAGQAGVMKNISGTKWEMPDGKKIHETTINKAPEKYFTEDVLAGIEKYVGENFVYGGGIEEEEPELELLEE